MPIVSKVLVILKDEQYSLAVPCTINTYFYNKNTGSHLVERLMNEGNEVICVDNCYSGSKSNIKKWMNNIKFEFIRHDITGE